MSELDGALRIALKARQALAASQRVLGKPQSSPHLGKRDMKKVDRATTALRALTSLRPSHIKSASARYFYELQAPSTEELLGKPFCKLAGSMGRDPWELAEEVVCCLDRFEGLGKTASDPRARELAQFYCVWGEDLEKQAANWFSGLKAVGKNLLSKAAPASQLASKGVIKSELPSARTAFRQAVPYKVAPKAAPTAGPRSAGQLVRQMAPPASAGKAPKQIAKKKGPGWFRVGAGAAAVGVPLHHFLTAKTPQPQYGPGMGAQYGGYA
jgi:hypothetical protein